MTDCVTNQGGQSFVKRNDVNAILENKIGGKDDVYEQTSSSHEGFCERFAEMNSDWMVTVASYGFANTFDDVAGRKQHGDDMMMVGPQIRPLKTEGDRKRIITSLPVTFSVQGVAFAQKVSMNNHYQYFELSRPPTVQLRFEYNNDADDNNIDSQYEAKMAEEDEKTNEYDTGDFEDDEEMLFSTMSTPVSVQLNWIYFPKEWPANEKDPYEKWLVDKCQETLHAARATENDGLVSFAVCQLCEREGLLYWHQEKKQPFYYHSYHVNDHVEEGKEGNSSSNSSNGEDSSNDESELIIEEMRNQVVSDDSPVLVLLPPNIIQAKPAGWFVDPTVRCNPSTKKHKHGTAEEEKVQVPARENIEGIFGPVIHLKTEAKKQYRIKHHSDVDVPTSAALSFALKALVANWEKLKVRDSSCPICFERLVVDASGGDTTTNNEGNTDTVDAVCLPGCGHMVCADCLQMYFQSIIGDGLSKHKKNPFCCPARAKCRRTFPIVGFVKQYVSDDHMAKIRDWYDRMKYPPSHTLDRCLSRSCPASYRATNDDNENADRYNDCMRIAQGTEHIVFCNVCDEHWCDQCLRRGVKDENHHCDRTQVKKFCRRYLNASDTKKEELKQKFPWLPIYSQMYTNDVLAVDWINENGQICPGCKTGVERIDGCFKMNCRSCNTVFCYDCGAELQPPYYDHGCWGR